MSSAPTSPEPVIFKVGFVKDLCAGCAENTRSTSVPCPYQCGRDDYGSHRFCYRFRGVGK